MKTFAGGIFGDTNRSRFRLSARFRFLRGVDHRNKRAAVQSLRRKRQARQAFECRFLSVSPPVLVAAAILPL